MDGGHDGKPSRTKMSVTLQARGKEWTVHFLEIAHFDAWWLIECAVEGPRKMLVTVRVEDQRSLGSTAQRVLNALRDLLQSGTDTDRAVLDLPAALQEAC